MKTYENCGFTCTLDDSTLKIEIPLENLVEAFTLSPNNFDESTVKPDKMSEFAEYVASRIVEECDSETGDTPLTRAFDTVFDYLLEGYENGDEFIAWGDREDRDFAPVAGE